MCGITGIFAFTQQGRSYLHHTKDAVKAIISRGPDHNNNYTHQQVSLGHVRLSIIDTSAEANQPFSDPSGRYTIVYNGEVYNHRELRQELIQNNGIVFRTQSDTEVILYQYITKGPEMLQELNGFFALAIYDAFNNSLFLARDRIGIKPLFIYQDEDKLIFSSEMKGLLAYRLPKILDHESLFTYLQLNYIPAPYSIFRNVLKQIPGTYKLISQKEIIDKTYYEIPTFESFRNMNPPTYDQAKIKLYQLLDHSVKKRLISDVPLGAFLSGGIDSSIIVALASKYLKNFNTFSIGFKEEAFFDETRYAQIVAEKYKTNHRVFSLDSQDIFDVLFNVLDYTDEPFADSSALAVYILSKHTRKHVKVALSGDGADELFSGYHKHTAEYYARKKSIGNLLVKQLQPFWQVFPQSRNHKIGNYARQLNRFAEGLKLSEKERYWRWCAYINEKDGTSLFKQQFDKEAYKLRKSKILSNINVKGSFNDVLLTDLLLVLQNDMLVKTDRMSMAHALEVRVPYLDHELLGFVNSLPVNYKIKGNFRKKILQDTFRDILPQEIYRRPKQGFEVPLLKWFRTSLKSDIENKWLNEEFIKEQGLFQSEDIAILKKRLFSHNPGEVQAQIWGLIVFQYWWEKNMSAV